MREIGITIGLLSISNVFMTFAWYAHLKDLNTKPWLVAALISWGIAFFEYCLQVPANRIGFQETGGPFSLVELKVLQEVITLVVFVIFSKIFFDQFQFTANHYIGFTLLIGAVYFIFKG